jgi:hypothetical protein
MEYGKWQKELVFFPALDLMDIIPMENYDGIVLLMSLLSHSRHRRIIKSFSKIGIRIPINGSRITSISALHHGGKNLVFEVQWQHSQQVRYGMAFIPDTT